MGLKRLVSDKHFGPIFYITGGQDMLITITTAESLHYYRGLASLGMPCHRGSGSHMVNGEKYRFLVMDRFGSDLQKIFQTGLFDHFVNKIFNCPAF
jgi:hypothetical protein